MKHLEKISYESAAGETKELFDKIKGKMGRVPNIYATMAHSPRAVNALLQMRETLSGGAFSPKEAEAIALVAAQENKCDYCMAAHAAIGKRAGLTDEEIRGFLRSESDDPKVKTLVQLTKEIIQTRGRPAAEKVEAFFGAGYGKAALSELIAQIALDIWTNYFNDVVETEIDFPKVNLK